MKYVIFSSCENVYMCMCTLKVISENLSSCYLPASFECSCFSLSHSLLSSSNFTEDKHQPDENMTTVAVQSGGTHVCVHSASCQGHSCRRPSHLPGECTLPVESMGWVEDTDSDGGSESVGRGGGGGGCCLSTVCVSVCMYVCMYVRHLSSREGGEFSINDSVLINL